MSRFESIKFWDQEVEDLFQEHGLPVCDAALQIREEAETFAKWISNNKIRSYLEIGVWTGKLISALDANLNFEKLAACDIKASTAFGLPVNLPAKTNLFHGNCLSPIYVNWRNKLGPVDLVLIDADHAYETTLRTIQVNAALKTKYIALCGISDKHRGINGVLPLWKELEGEKVEIVKPHSEIGLDYSTIGIGIWKVI